MYNMSRKRSGGTKMKAAFYTLGCKVNQYETNELRALLAQSGWSFAAPGEEADVYIVNSCTVTAESSRKSRQALRRLKNAHPQAAIVLTGCYPQAFPEETTAIPEADIVLGNKNNARLPALLRTFFAHRERLTLVSPHGPRDLYTGGTVSEFEGHSRAFVKIQDGCNRRCSYCIIPTSRGFSRSKPLPDVKKELERVAANGYKEVVFVGINLSAYGLDAGGTLTDALALAEEIPGIRRIRLGSLEPDHITDPEIERLKTFTKFCPQFHLSLQSGCDKTLRAMNRHYTTAEYAALCEKLKEAFPSLSLTTDVIAGFPGETEADFEESAAFVRRIGFMKAHIFPYSRREGTRAAVLPGQLSTAEKAARCKALEAVCEELRRDFLQSSIGRTADVLFETPKNGLQRGYTENYIPVTTAASRRLTGEILPVTLTGIAGDGCTCELCI